MPVVAVERDFLFNRLGDNYGSKPGVQDDQVDDRFQVVCFNFGIELDDVTTERAMKEKETGSVDSNASDAIIYKFDIPANRYDLLCLEGLSRSLSIFHDREKLPNYHLSKPQKLERMIVRKEVKEIRSFVVCAVLRGLHFDERNYQSFIDLQEKLHQNICRRRTLASIGTHDLDTIQGPFTYEALAPKDIQFAPLNNRKVMDGVELMNHLDNDLHLKKFLPLIRDAPRYPVIYDANRVVLSLPPIINGDHSKITLKTKNVFIEVTGTDLTKAQITLNTVCAMFSEYCSDKFSVEPVEVEEADGTVTLTPDLSMRNVETNVDYINRSIGANIAPEEIVKLLSRMSLPAVLASDRKTLSVSVPITRSDILHACDVMEDVAIAFGYNNLKIEFPNTNTPGKQQTVNKISDLLRHEVAFAGYSEVLTLTLCSREENYQFLNKADDGLAVTLSNPKTPEFQVARTSLLVGLLKTISTNRRSSLPIRVFEVSDVVFKTEDSDVGARNQRNLCAINCSHSSGFEIVHGLLDQLMVANGVKWQEQGKEVQGNKYYLKPSDEPTFFPGRRADVIYNDKKIGVIGIIHPEVLAHFHIPFPCSAVELNLEPLI